MNTEGAIVYPHLSLTPAEITAFMAASASDTTAGALHALLLASGTTGGGSVQRRSGATTEPAVMRMRDDSDARQPELANNTSFRSSSWYVVQRTAYWEGVSSLVISPGSLHTDNQKESVPFLWPAPSRSS
jgi:hypothetical protein